MRIINIGVPIENDNTESIDILSDNTFMDADLVTINLDMLFYQIHGSHKAIGQKIKITQTRFNFVKKKLNERISEINELLIRGGTVVIEIPSQSKFQYQLTYDNGESMRQTETIDYLSLLPIEPIELTNKTGRNITPTEPLSKNSKVLFFCKYQQYQAIISGKNGHPILKIKNTNYIVGKYYKYKKGIILLLPQFDVIFSDFKNNKSLKFDYFDIVRELVSYISNKNDLNKIPIPDWATQIFPYEMEINTQFQNLLKEESKIKNKINETKLQVSQLAELKLLLYGTGNQLEEKIEFIFRQFGYEVKKPKGNRDDLIIKYKHDVCVVEVKGVTKSAAEKHSAQLQKWVSNYHVENNHNPKGLLLINTYKDTPINKRREDDFPNQMMKYVKQMDHALLTTAQLFSIYLDFEQKKISLMQIHNLIHSTIGQIEYKVSDNILPSQKNNPKK